MSILHQYPLLTYAIRMTLISAVCYTYYLVFLRGKSFHTYNRIYLLVSTLLALLLPRIHISSTWLHSTDPANPVVILLSPAPSTDPVAAPTSPSYLLLLLAGIYILITVFLFLRLARSIYIIIRLTHRCPSTRQGAIRIFEMQGTYAPFSFLNWLFWDPVLDPVHGQGRLIFLHESHHIHHRHTLDILGMELLKAICWFNPFFYWTSKELKTLHEFAADRYAISQNNTSRGHFDYAELLVWQSMEKNIPITHSFFNNQLKRRIHMIIQTSRRQPGFLTRIIALPLLLLLTALFTTSPARTQSPADTASTHKLLRWFNRHLRYPEKDLVAGKEGTIWFSIQMGQGGNLLGFTPIDQTPAGQPLQRISVMSRPNTKPGGQVSDKEALKYFIEDARASAEKMNSPHPRDEYVNSALPGQYYFEITYKIEK